MKTNLKYREEQKLTFKDADDNFRALMYWSGQWSAGTYEKNELVWHKGILWVAVTTTTSEPNLVDQTDWTAMSPVVGRAQVAVAGPKSAADITAAWRPLDGFDLVTIQSMGMDFDLATGVYTPLWRGLWQYNFYFSMSHDEAQSGRNIGIRRYNMTTGTATSWASIVGIGRNADATTFGFSDLVEVFNSDSWRYEIGGFDIVSSVVWNNLLLGFKQVSII